ncbi:MAG: hypothetical protein Q8889_02300 [Candidatus Phytoplasma australasiaticum]|nr:hypothetical protein [Candidatus Phytoplasma australasiaticum]MDV3199933.1 hypothetical protein [Candidatus Phytoplasma australasiaticum]
MFLGKKIIDFIKKNKIIIQKFNFLFSDNEEEFFKKFDLLYQENLSIFEFLPILIANNYFLKKEKFIFLNNNNQEIIYDYQNKDIVINFIKESHFLSKFFLIQIIIQILRVIF